MVRKLYFISLFLLTICVGCQWKMSPSVDEKEPDGVTIERYDRVEELYLTMADFAALHQLKTDYPIQTRTLIEDVLQLGPANDPDINMRWLMYFQDSTLQALLRDVERQYDNIDDINQQLTMAFGQLGKMIPGMEPPKVYTQIGSLDQSIVVTDSMLAISLDKYLGADYPAYLRYGYTESQRKMMSREYIVPDCLGFYLLSLFPFKDSADTLNEQRHWHMMKIQHLVNKAMGKQVFTNDTIEKIDKYWREHSRMTAPELLLHQIELL